MKISKLVLNFIQEQFNFSKLDPTTNGNTLVTRRSDIPCSFIIQIPTAELLESERNLLKAFRTYFNKTWLSGNNNLSLFYYEKATNNGAESYHKH